VVSIEQHDGFVVASNQIGEFTIWTKLATCDPNSQEPLAYAGPGYVARLERPNGQMVIDDLRHKVQNRDLAFMRGGYNGGLGDFACDWHREGAGMVLLDQRRISNGPPFSTFWHKWMTHRISTGVYAVDNIKVAKKNNAVSLKVRTRHRDPVGHALDVLYDHLWTLGKWTCAITVVLNPSGGERCWIKEPRSHAGPIVGDKGISIVDTRGGVHHYPLSGLKDPTKQTLTVGPTANNPANRYARKGVLLPGGLLAFPGGFERSGFSAWRSQVTKRQPPEKVRNTKDGKPIGDYNPHSDPTTLATIRILPSGSRLPTATAVRGGTQRRLVLEDNWEVTKQSDGTVGVHFHAWPASITIFDYCGALRRVHRGESHRLSMTLT
jgi:hypothetical protein